MRHELNANFLAEKQEKGLLSENLKIANADSNARIDFADACVQVKNQIFPNVWNQVVDQEQFFKQGITDFRAGELHFFKELGIILKGLKIQYANKELYKIDKSKNETLLGLSFGYKRPALLENSRIEIVQDGRILLSFPINIIQGVSRLEHWIYLKGDSFIKVNIKCPEQEDLGEEKEQFHAVEVSLLGDAIVRY